MRFPRPYPFKETIDANDSKSPLPSPTGNAAAAHIARSSSPARSASPSRQRKGTDGMKALFPIIGFAVNVVLPLATPAANTSIAFAGTTAKEKVNLGQRCISNINENGVDQRTNVLDLCHCALGVAPAFAYFDSIVKSHEAILSAKADFGEVIGRRLEAHEFEVGGLIYEKLQHKVMCCHSRWRVQQHPLQIISQSHGLATSRLELLIKCVVAGNKPSGIYAGYQCEQQAAESLHDNRGEYGSLHAATTSSKGCSIKPKGAAA